MELWARLSHLELTWTGLFVMIGAFVAVLFLRRLLPPARRHRGRLSAMLLGAAPILHLVATGVGLLGAKAASAAIHLLNLLFVIGGVTGVASMVVFDIVLGRTKVPTITRDLSQAIGFVLVLLGVLHSGGINPLSVITTSAVATAILGLALQGMLTNVVAGLVLQVDGTFALGDWIQWGQHVGRIAQINWRSSSIVTRDGDTAIVPNAQLLSNQVLNLSRPTRARRASIEIAFHHRHSPGEVEKAMVAAARDVPGVKSEPPPSCTPMGFGAAQVKYALVYWVEDIARETAIEGAVRARVWYAAERSGLEGPCPRRDAGGEDPIELEERLAALARVAIFAPLADDDRRLLARAMARRRFAPAETILREGEPGDSLFVIEDGSVRVTVLGADGFAAAGREGGAELATLRAGDCFGEMSLLTGDPRQATCVAISESVLYEIGVASMRRVLDVHPEVARAIADLLAMRHLALAGTAKPAPADAEVAKARLWTRVRTYFHLAG